MYDINLATVNTYRLPDAVLSTSELKGSRSQEQINKTNHFVGFPMHNRIKYDNAPVITIHHKEGLTRSQLEYALLSRGSWLSSAAVNVVLADDLYIVTDGPRISAYYNVYDRAFCIYSEPQLYRTVPLYYNKQNSVYSTL